MEANSEKKAFKKGLREVDAMPGNLGKKVRKDLMKGLSLKSRQAFSNRAKGCVTHTPIEAGGIERVFADYGCNSPWGV